MQKLIAFLFEQPMFARFKRLFVKPPKEWPQYAHECGWAPKPDNPNFPFILPPSYHYRSAQALGATFVFWVCLRAKEDGAHEILGIHPWEH